MKIDGVEDLANGGVELVLFVDVLEGILIQRECEGVACDLVDRGLEEPVSESLELGLSE